MHNWSFLYQYVLGGGFLFACTWLLVRARAIDPETPEGRRALVMLIGVFLFLAGLHAASVFVLPHL